MYAELQAKTSFSFLDGASQPVEIAQRAIELGISALAITDFNGVYGLPRAYAFTKNHPDFKLISGCELKLEDQSFISLIARDRAAYGNMCRLITAAHADKEKGEAFLKKQELKPAPGLIAIVSPDQDLAWLKEVFGDRLYLKISLHREALDKKRLEAVLEKSAEFDIKVIATNQVLYHVPERKKLQDAFTCIRKGKTLLDAGYELHQNGERYLKSPFEMRLLFKDHPQFLKNTLQIAESCTFSLKELRYRYPSEWIPGQQNLWIESAHKAWPRHPQNIC